MLFRSCMVYNRPDSRRLIVFVHGNAMTIGSLHDSGLPEALSSTACADVITVEYPGYGVAPKPSEDLDSACSASVAAVLSYARRKGATNITLMGRSLGCAIVLRAMASNPRLNNVVSNVILLSGFTSVRDMCKYDWQRKLIRDRLVNKRNILQLAPTIGVSILHGTRDELVPFEHAKILHKCRTNSVLHPIINMTHCPNAAEITHIACLVQNITACVHGNTIQWTSESSLPLAGDSHGPSNV